MDQKYQRKLAGDVGLAQHSPEFFVLFQDANGGE